MPLREGKTQADVNHSIAADSIFMPFRCRPSSPRGLFARHHHKILSLRCRTRERLQVRVHAALEEGGPSVGFDRRQLRDSFHDVHASHNAADHQISCVQIRRGSCRDDKSRAIWHAALLLLHCHQLALIGNQPLLHRPARKSSKTSHKVMCAPIHTIMIA